MPRRVRERVILDVAYPAFARRGYAAVSMAEIAAAAGVTKPILYRYFDSKDGLCAACADQMVGPMLTVVGDATRREPYPDRQLWAGIVAQLRFIEEHRDEWRVYVREAPSRGGRSEAALEEGRRRVTQLLAELMQQATTAAGRPGPARKEFEAQAHALQGAVEQIAIWWEANPEETVGAVALRVMNFAWQGFGNILAGEFWMPP
jgi:AcrR family transcriptional regulator